MIYAILFEDSESHSDQRAKYMEAHLTFLEANAEIIKAAGPCQILQPTRLLAGCGWWRRKIYTLLKPWLKPVRCGPPVCANP